MTEKYSGYTRDFLLPNQAMEKGWYKPETEVPADEYSEIEKLLIEQGFSILKSTFSEADFQALVNQFETVLADGSLPYLQRTYHTVDRRKGHEAGYERKEHKIDAESGKQIADAKHLFHFNPHAYARWKNQFRNAPQEFREFLEKGMQLMDESLGIVHEAVTQLENTHRGLTNVHFPGKQKTSSFLRVVTYDGYEPSSHDTTENLVAGSHYDRGSFTTQLYASSDGLYIQTPNGEMVEAPYQPNSAYFFPGLGIPKLYMGQTRLPATAHEVRRLDKQQEYVPARTAIILFLDPAFIDLAITPEEAHLLTQPKLANG